MEEIVWQADQRPQHLEDRDGARGRLYNLPLPRKRPSTWPDRNALRLGPVRLYVKDTADTPFTFSLTWFSEEATEVIDTPYGRGTHHRVEHLYRVVIERRYKYYPNSASRAGEVDCGVFIYLFGWRGNFVIGIVIKNDLLSAGRWH